jgi:hypothetical protein
VCRRRIIDLRDLDRTSFVPSLVERFRSTSTVRNTKDSPKFNRQPHNLSVVFSQPFRFVPASEQSRNVSLAHGRGPKTCLFFGYPSESAVNLQSTYGSKALVRAREETKLQQATIGERIVDLVRANPDCTLDELMEQLPDLNWSDVFLEVDRLNRSGHLRLIQDNLVRFTTTLRLL